MPGPDRLPRTRKRFPADESDFWTAGSPSHTAKALLPEVQFLTNNNVPTLPKKSSEYNQSDKFPCRIHPIFVSFVLPCQGKGNGCRTSERMAAGSFTLYTGYSGLQPCNKFTHIIFHLFCGGKTHGLIGNILKFLYA